MVLSLWLEYKKSEEKYRPKMLCAVFNLQYKTCLRGITKVIVMQRICRDFEF